MQKTASADHLARFGQAVRAARTAAGLSQEALADHAGLHRTYVGSVERGERNISLVNIYAIATAMSLRPQELFELADNQ